jgi:hypothetical protein
MCAKLHLSKRLKCVRPYMVAIQFKCTYNFYRKLTVWHSAATVLIEVDVHRSIVADAHH